MCPPLEDRPGNCRICCCQTSDNADFYHPDTAIQQCTATEVADYKVSLIPTINSVCHSSYPFFGGGVTSSYFSDLLLTTHAPVQVFDSCGENIFQNTRNYITSTEEQVEFTIGILDSEVEKDDVLFSYYLRASVLERGNRNRRSARINMSPSQPYLTLISKLVRLDTYIECHLWYALFTVQLPSGPDDQWVGFSGLNLCGPDGWKKRVQVCLPLLAIANRTADPNAETQLQGNHCSFANALIERRAPPVSPLPPGNCTPHDGKYNLIQKHLRDTVILHRECFRCPRP